MSLIHGKPEEKILEHVEIDRPVPTWWGFAICLLPYIFGFPLALFALIFASSLATQYGLGTMSIILTLAISYVAVLPFCVISAYLMHQVIKRQTMHFTRMQALTDRLLAVLRERAAEVGADVRSHVHAIEDLLMEARASEARYGFTKWLFLFLIPLIHLLAVIHISDVLMRELTDHAVREDHIMRHVAYILARLGASLVPPEHISSLMFTFEEGLRFGVVGWLAEPGRGGMMDRLKRGGPFYLSTIIRLMNEHFEAHEEINYRLTSIMGWLSSLRPAPIPRAEGIVEKPVQRLAPAGPGPTVQVPLPMRELTSMAELRMLARQGSREKMHVLPELILILGLNPILMIVVFTSPLLTSIMNNIGNWEALFSTLMSMALIYIPVLLIALIINGVILMIGAIMLHYYWSKHTGRTHRFYRSLLTALRELSDRQGIDISAYITSIEYQIFTMIREEGRKYTGGVLFYLIMLIPVIGLIYGFFKLIALAKDWGTHDARECALMDHVTTLLSHMGRCLNVSRPIAIRRRTATIHGLLTVLTLGLWAPVWCYMTLRGLRNHFKIHRETESTLLRALEI